MERIRDRADCCRNTVYVWKKIELGEEMKLKTKESYEIKQKGERESKVKWVATL